VPLFALRSNNDLGIGDTESLREMIDWCSQHQFGILQLLPVNETGDDNSPYNAISSLALDPTTIFIWPGHVPDLSQKAFDEIATKEVVNKLRVGPVQYRNVKILKLQLLEKAFEQFLKEHDSKNTPRASQFRNFLNDH